MVATVLALLGKKREMYFAILKRLRTSLTQVGASAFLIHFSCIWIHSLCAADHSKVFNTGYVELAFLSLN